MAKINDILRIIAEEHKISFDSLIETLKKKDMLPKTLLGDAATDDSGPYDNKRAKKYAEDNGISIAEIVGTGRNGRITIADMKKKTSTGGKVKISAAAAKLASENGIDISKIVPSGKNGDILLKDIREIVQFSKDLKNIREIQSKTASLIEEEEPIIED
jgi:pyruvate/2-oxoglutarate dehydrogenase complex dihydrolipoamide acyltransferase (E2) component